MAPSYNKNQEMTSLAEATHRQAASTEMWIKVCLVAGPAFVSLLIALALFILNDIKSELRNISSVVIEHIGDHHLHRTSPPTAKD